MKPHLEEQESKEAGLDQICGVQDAILKVCRKSIGC